MDALKIFREKGRCCISGKPMKDSKHMNLVILDYAPEWDYPVSGNVLMPDQPKRAVGLVHDDF